MLSIGRRGGLVEEAVRTSIDNLVCMGLPRRSMHERREHAFDHAAPPYLTAP
ncbi:uncharacterized protein MYCFIDRAFT_177675 [Pseudocercospora fijiensis CIRAD86]|uniref:Uncharacterized protein n=1 Tax=Pseudocercospora fijiensis (strain CIRAD86) TaxID=383855 RepID=M3APD3_PSEFD|nr:uncharacterized protein MYCFIDRAFT_177675 [Pseudocercospora fijiensis CIRAD86]EME78988.1 hypothetical protein MYCFIDRAFT_177675 [Pseudocercospora fijiensis CIRAD86]